MRIAPTKNQIAEYVMEHRDNLYRLAYSYTRNADDALDIVQESVCKAMASRQSLKDFSLMRVWIYRIVVNTSLDVLRKRRRLVPLGDDALQDDVGVRDRYTDIDLLKALDDLALQDRSIVVLHYFEDLKLDEVAFALELNVNTVKTRLYRALERLRALLGETHPETPTKRRENERGNP